MNGKLKSRKLWAWIVWTILTGVSFYFTKTVDANIIGWYGAVTCMYLGSNTATKYIFRNKQE